MDSVLKQLAGLPVRGTLAEALRPMLEVQVLLEEQDPHAKSRVEQACDGKEARLVKVTLTRTGHGGGLVDSAPDCVTLGDLKPEDVIERLYARAYKGALPADLRQAFHDLLEQVHQEQDA